MAGISREEFRSWCIQELSKITDCPDDIVDYVFKIENLDEVEDYFREFFGDSAEKHSYFIDNLLKGLSSTRHDEVEGKWLRKEKDPETFPKKQNRKSDKKKGIEKEEKKKPAKFVPLYSKEGEARTSVRLPGRHPCECLAQKHSLINNCTSCGRIVCEQEGVGPCYFCGSLVCTKADQEVIARQSKKSAKLMKQLMQQDFSAEVKNLKTTTTKEMEGYKKAIEHKNKLLEYDKTSARRTHVIDDECDYFSTNSKWLSNEERINLERREQELREKRHGSRKNIKVTLDFAGRKVVEDNNGIDMYEMEPEVAVLASGYYTKEKEKSLVDPRAFPDLILQFKPSKSQKGSASGNKGTVNNDSKVMRVQDKELQEMRDPGMCLSMHQPWASLLITGIKKVEGRSWYTSHRGRLWIAATVKKPTDLEIGAVENMYKEMYQSTILKFPREYPTGCLLGFVDMVHCWSHEEYKEKCHNETESESPYVFICENPQQLLLKVPVKGQHKIWKLDPQTHKEVKMAQKF